MLRPSCSCGHTVFDHRGAQWATCRVCALLAEPRRKYDDDCEVRATRFQSSANQMADQSDAPRSVEAEILPPEPNVITEERRIAVTFDTEHSAGGAC